MAATVRNMENQIKQTIVTKEDAEAFANALKDSFSGSWKQILLAQKWGVPRLLGYASTKEFVYERFGGYMQLSIEDRREAVLELRSQGESNRSIGQILGVGKSTVDRDSGVPNGILDDDVSSEGDSRGVPKGTAKDWITLTEWKNISHEDQQKHLRMRSDKAQFNAQDNASIEWAQWSWNPVTGCKHDCPYCYARDIANRVYPQGFEPSFHPQRLSAPINTKLPNKSDVSYRNVFTCSMADLFGRWVPQEWIDAVFHCVVENPQWNFLFLTKFPKRLVSLQFPDNAWIGTTVDCQARVKAAEDAFAAINAKVKWLSVEPMIEPLEFTRLGLFQWIVIGGASRSTQTPEWRVPFDWWMPLHLQAKNLGLAVYHKENLMTERERAFPGHPHVNPNAAPTPFDYLSHKKKDDVLLGET